MKNSTFFFNFNITSAFVYQRMVFYFILIRMWTQFNIHATLCVNCVITITDLDMLPLVYVVEIIPSVLLHPVYFVVSLSHFIHLNVLLIVIFMYNTIKGQNY